MAGTWPNLDGSDLLTRVRTYLNEYSAVYFADTDIYQWMAVGIKDISQKSLCVRRILSTQALRSTRTVATNVYKVYYVEYIPSSGRPIMLPKISPTEIGTRQLNGTLPQFWYEFGSTIGIEPTPDAIYDLKLYVADIPKLTITKQTSFSSGWTAGATGFVLGTSAVHTGAVTGSAQWDTHLVTATNYTITFSVTTCGTTGAVIPYIGITAGIEVTGIGEYAENILSAGTDPHLVLYANNTITIDNVNIYKEADISAAGDQTELEPIWQHLIVLYATFRGLQKDRKWGPAYMVESIYSGQLEYTKNLILDPKPDSYRNLVYY